jgi:hypothetical protein
LSADASHARKKLLFASDGVHDGGIGWGPMLCNPDPTMTTGPHAQSGHAV